MQVVAGRISTVANADYANEYAGLSSEFAYYDGDATACFGFSTPIATRSDALGASLTPIRTTIVIKRIKASEVSTVFNETIMWGR